MRFLESTDPDTGVTTWFEFGHANRLECHASAPFPGDPSQDLTCVTLTDAEDLAMRERASRDLVTTLGFIRQHGPAAYEREITRAGQKGIILIGSRKP